MKVSLAVQHAAHAAVARLQELSGVIAIVIASADGFDIASSVSGDVDAARIAAMASSISAIGAVVAQEGKLGQCRQITVNTKDGFVHVARVDRPDGELVLSVMAQASAVLALVAYSAAGQVRALEVA